MDLLLLSRREHKEDLLRREKCNAMGGTGERRCHIWAPYLKSDAAFGIPLSLSISLRGGNGSRPLEWTEEGKGGEEEESFAPTRWREEEEGDRSDMLPSLPPPLCWMPKRILVPTTWGMCGAREPSIR